MPVEARIGSFVLDTLTTGMYNNPLDCIRELVQNASDSLQSAERDGLTERGAGRISISISAEERKLTISDNGTGISLDEAGRKLLDIGKSDKVLESDAGFRGIGRLAALAYCAELVFRTSAKGEPEGTEVRFNASKIREAMDPFSERNVVLQDLIANSVNVSRFAEKKDRHFFEVQLVTIDEQVPELVNIRALEDYLKQVAPIPFHSTRFLFAPKINEWAEANGAIVPSHHITLSEGAKQRALQKAYDGDTRTSDNKYRIEVMDIRFGLEKDENGKPLYWYWIAEPDELLGTVGNQLIAGLRLRMNNIQIGGPENFGEIFAAVAGSYYRFNAWFMGEIHILDRKVVPNARRDGFEKNEAWVRIQLKLQALAKTLAKEAYQASESRKKPISKLVMEAKTCQDKVEKQIETGIVSKEQREELVGKIEKTKRKLEDAKKGQREKKDLQKLDTVLSSLSQSLEDVKRAKYVTEHANSQLDKKQRLLLREVYRVLHRALDESNFQIAKDALAKRFHLPEGED